MSYSPVKIPLFILNTFSVLLNSSVSLFWLLLKPFLELLRSYEEPVYQSTLICPFIETYSPVQLLIYKRKKGFLCTCPRCWSAESKWLHSGRWTQKKRRRRWHCSLKCVWAWGIFREVLLQPRCNNIITTPRPTKEKLKTLNGKGEKV